MWVACGHSTLSEEWHMGSMWTQYTVTRVAHGKHMDTVHCHKSGTWVVCGHSTLSQEWHVGSMWTQYTVTRVACG